MIDLYSKEGCPRCKVLKAKLDKANINYNYIVCKEGDENFQYLIDRKFIQLPALRVGDDLLDLTAAKNWIEEQVNAK